MAAHGCGGRVEHLSVCGKVNGRGPPATSQAALAVAG